MINFLCVCQCNNITPPPKKEAYLCYSELTWAANIMQSNLPLALVFMLVIPSCPWVVSKVQWMGPQYWQYYV